MSSVRLKYKPSAWAHGEFIETTLVCVNSTRDYTIFSRNTKQNISSVDLLSCRTSFTLDWSIGFCEHWIGIGIYLGCLLLGGSSAHGTAIVTISTRIQQKEKHSACIDQQPSWSDRPATISAYASMNGRGFLWTLVRNMMSRDGDTCAQMYHFSSFK